MLSEPERQRFCLSSGTLDALAPCRVRRGWGRREVISAPGIPLALAVILLLAALLVAPEQPLAQEAICQRHNGVAACRVW